MAPPMQQRMLDILAEVGAKLYLLYSGDVNSGEITSFDRPGHQISPGNLWLQLVKIHDGRYLAEHGVDGYINHWRLPPCWEPPIWRYQHDLRFACQLTFAFLLNIILPWNFS